MKICAVQIRPIAGEIAVNIVRHLNFIEFAIAQEATWSSSPSCHSQAASRASRSRSPPTRPITDSINFSSAPTHTTSSLEWDCQSLRNLRCKLEWFGLPRTRLAVTMRSSSYKMTNCLFSFEATVNSC